MIIVATIDADEDADELELAEAINAALMDVPGVESVTIEADDDDDDGGDEE